MSSVNQYVPTIAWCVKKWNLNGLHKPICVHGCVALRHAPSGVAERFLADLREAGEHVKVHPEEMESMATVWGMAATRPCAEWSATFSRSTWI